MREHRSLPTMLFDTNIQAPLGIIIFKCNAFANFQELLSFPTSVRVPLLLPRLEVVKVFLSFIFFTLLSLCNFYFWGNSNFCVCMCFCWLFPECYVIFPLCGCGLFGIVWVLARGDVRLFKGWGWISSRFFLLLFQGWLYRRSLEFKKL